MGDDGGVRDDGAVLIVDGAADSALRCRLRKSETCREQGEHKRGDYAPAKARTHNRLLVHLQINIWGQARKLEHGNGGFPSKETLKRTVELLHFYGFTGFHKREMEDSGKRSED